MPQVIKIIKDNSVEKQGNETERNYFLRNYKVVPNDYELTEQETEVTTLKHLQILLEEGLIDDRTYRSGLYKLGENVYIFNTLDQQIQIELAKKYATTYTNTLSVFPNFWDRVENGCFEYHIKMVQARTNRFNWCCSAILNGVQPQAYWTIIAKIVANDFLTTYIKFGIEGTSEEHMVGLYDYVNSTPGTPFENNGLLEDLNRDYNEGVLDEFGEPIPFYGNMLPETVTELVLIEKINDCLKLGIFYKG